MMEYSHQLTWAVHADSWKCLQLLGFNCLRLPFSFQNLLELRPTNITKPCFTNSTAEIRLSVTPPDEDVSVSIPLPVQVRILRGDVFI